MKKILCKQQDHFWWPWSDL